jgi:hypothetical protein
MSLNKAKSHTNSGFHLSGVFAVCKGDQCQKYLSNLLVIQIFPDILYVIDRKNDVVFL